MHFQDAMVQVVGGRLVDFWGLRGVVTVVVEVVGSIGCVVVMVVDDEGLIERQRWWVGVRLLSLLLLSKDINSVL
jgi:hypothetical protein